MNELMVTPEILLQLGFCLIQDAEYNNHLVPHFEHPVICYVEKACRRQAILLLLDGCNKDGWNVDVYLQEDIACGFGRVWHNWAGLDVDRLNDLYRFSAGKDLPGYKFMKFKTFTVVKSKYDGITYKSIKGDIVTYNRGDIIMPGNDSLNPEG